MADYKFSNLNTQDPQEILRIKLLENLYREGDKQPVPAAAENFDFHKELKERVEQRKGMLAMEPEIRKRCQMPVEEFLKQIRLAMYERKLYIDSIMLRQDKDSHSGKTCVSGSSTPHYADDAYASVVDELMKTDFLKADADDLADFVDGPQKTLDEGKKTM